MKFGAAAFAALIAASSATPVVRTRPLTPRENDMALKQRDSCPMDLQPDFLFPHLIVPISAKNPNTKYGTVFSPIFTPNDFCTIFNFDVPVSAAGKNCTLEFLFPTQSELQTSSFTIDGPGDFIFTGYAPGSGATLDTTFNNQPAPGPFPPFPPLVLKPGNAYIIDVGPCVIVDNAPTVVSGKTCTSDTYFTYFQDFNPCPIGLYVGVTDA